MGGYSFVRRAFDGLLVVLFAMTALSVLGNLFGPSFVRLLGPGVCAMTSAALTFFVATGIFSFMMFLLSKKGKVYRTVDALAISVFVIVISALSLYNAFEEYVRLSKLTLAPGQVAVLVARDGRIHSSYTKPGEYKKHFNLATKVLVVGSPKGCSSVLVSCENSPPALISYAYAVDEASIPVLLSKNPQGFSAEQLDEFVSAEAKKCLAESVDESERALKLQSKLEQEFKNNFGLKLKAFGVASETHFKS